MNNDFNAATFINNKPDVSLDSLLSNNIASTNIDPSSSSNDNLVVTNKITTIQNVKLVTRINNDYKPENLVKELSAELIKTLSTSTQPRTRFRLYPYFIYDGARDTTKETHDDTTENAKKTKVKKKAISSSDLNLISNLQPYLDNLKRVLNQMNNTNKSSDTSDKLKSSSLLKQLDRLIHSVDSGMSHNYKVLIQNVCDKVEESVPFCIIMPAFDSKVNNSKQISNDVINDNGYQYNIYCGDSCSHDILNNLYKSKVKKPTVQKQPKTPKEQKQKGSKKRAKNSETIPVDENQQRQDIINTLKD